MIGPLAGALDGVRVLEAGPLLPVPSAGANLHRLGALVTRLEPPAGDPARRLYGGWLHELYGENKQAMRLDLRTAAGRGSLADLLDGTDVMLVGYRPGAQRRLGLDAARVRDGRQAIVHCSIVGHATAGADAERPGHDLSFLAAAGMLDEPAGPSAVGQPPRRPPIPVADLAAGAVATQAVLTALLMRERSGDGCAIEIPIADVALAWAAPRLGHAVSRRYGRALDPANDIYRCGDDRYLTIAAIEPAFWASLCAALEGVVELPPNASALTSADRVRRSAELLAVLQQAFAERPADAWRLALEGAGVPVDEVASAQDVVGRVGVDLDSWRRLAVPLPVGAAS